MVSSPKNSWSGQRHLAIFEQKLGQYVFSHNVGIIDGLRKKKMNEKLHKNYTEQQRKAKKLILTFWRIL